MALARALSIIPLLLRGKEEAVQKPQKRHKGQQIKEHKQVFWYVTSKELQSKVPPVGPR